MAAGVFDDAFEGVGGIAQTVARRLDRRRNRNRPSGGGPAPKSA